MLTPYEKQQRGLRRVKKRLSYAIRNYKDSLRARVARRGIYENIGQKERRKLENALSEWARVHDLCYANTRECREMIDTFEQWAMNYTGGG